MSAFTSSGRKKESWEQYVGAFCERGGILSDSILGRALYALSDEEFQELAAVCDPGEDALLHVDRAGFTVNHGNVGTRGIRYDFRTSSRKTTKQGETTMNYNQFMNSVASLTDAVLLSRVLSAIIRYDGRELISGYLVALQAYEHVYPLVEYIGDYESLLHGILCHASDGYKHGQDTSDAIGISLYGRHLYVERVAVVGDEQTALELARENDKQTIYHIDTGEQIRLDYE
jgi:hypothetical protein